MSLDPIIFPAREEHIVTRIYKAIGKFENKYPNLTMYLVWAAAGAVLAVIVVVRSPA